ncbi:CAunnamed protein product [Biomphalaria glabrata]|nr:CAunnamed protein product [Biomphalaria glabrata]
MDAKNGQMYFVRNIEDGQTVSLSGDGQFCIGLTQNENIACSLRSGGQQDSDIIVPLVLITVWKTSGVTISPANRDLNCTLNGVNIESEANIIPGNQIEIGDKILELLSDGMMNKPQRRHLPPTPGVTIHPTPPPKPQRTLGKMQLDSPHESPPESRDALREWCLSHLPKNDFELLEIVKKSDQLSGLASSYLIQHINLHTDVVMSVDLTDRIFKMMQEISQHRRDIVKGFISDIMKESNQESQEKHNGYHGRVTAFLVEILEQFLDPSYLVLLCLQLLRALSHVPGNVVTLIANNTVAAVLGSMAVYKDNETVQSNSLDILAKLATYIPALLEKPPMRESAIDLASMAMSLHSRNLRIIQAGIRTLANLGSTLHTLANIGMKGSPYPELRAYVSLVIEVLDYLYTNTRTLVPNALSTFSTDLTVKTDGRRFLFEYGKLEQLKHQQKLWELAPDVPPRRVDSGLDGCDNNNLPDDASSGILKRSRSFENLRNPERRVSFVEESDLVSSASFSSSASSDDEPRQQSNSPDIQILSRSTISPLPLSKSDSTDRDSSVTGDIPVRPARRTVGAPPLINIRSDSDVDSVHELNDGVVYQAQSDIINTSSSLISPVDITGHQFSATDISFMKRLISVQMIGYVCSASVQGDNPKALKLINMPLKEFLQQSSIPKALCQFARDQFEESTTLMDIDPSTVISAIDAVRYKMLAFDLTKKSLEVLIQHLISKSLDGKVLAVTWEVIQSIIHDKVLSPAISSEEFLEGVEASLQKLRLTCQTTDPVVSLVEKINYNLRLKSN